MNEILRKYAWFGRISICSGQKWHRCFTVGVREFVGCSNIAFKPDGIGPRRDDYGGKLSRLEFRPKIAVQKNSNYMRFLRTSKIRRLEDIYDNLLEKSPNAQLLPSLSQSLYTLFCNSGIIKANLVHSLFWLQLLWLFYFFVKRRRSQNPARPVPISRNVPGRGVACGSP
jgi:hypothetical protein